MVSIPSKIGPSKIGRVGKIGLGVLVAGIAILVYYYLGVDSNAFIQDIPRIAGIIAVCVGIALMVLGGREVKVEQAK